MGIEEVFNGTSEEPQPEAIEQPPVEAVETPEPQVEEPKEPEQPEPTVQEESRHVPLATFLDQRDELKRYKQELEALRQQNQPKPIEAPDPLDDPQGYAEYQDRKIDERMTQQRFQISDTIARQQHGADTVDAAAQWAAERAQRDPAFAMSYMRQDHPIDWIVQQHKQDQLLTEIGGNVDDWFTREAAKRGFVAAPDPNAAAPAVAPQQMAPAPVTPPRSLASIPGAGGVTDVPTGPMAALGSVFKG